MGKIFLIKVSFYIAFDKLFMGRKFSIPYLLSFRVESVTRVHPRNVLNKSQIKSHIKLQIKLQSVT